MTRITRSLLIALLAFLAPSMLAADDSRLPTQKQLEEFIQHCQQQIARHKAKPDPAKAPATTKKEVAKQEQAPPHTATDKDRAQAHRLAVELSKEKKLEKSRIKWYLDRFKKHNVPGIFVSLYPLLTYDSLGETRWLIFNLGESMLPKVFDKRLARKRPGALGNTKSDDAENEALKLQCHSPQHLALRNWMINGGALKTDAEAKRLVGKRIRKALALLKELQDARDEDAAEHAMVRLAQTGEEWIVYPLVFNKPISKQWVRTAANRLLKHFTGKTMADAARGGRRGGKRREEQVKKRWQRRSKQFVRNFIFKQNCDYCEWVVKKVVLKTGD